MKEKEILVFFTVCERDENGELIPRSAKKYEFTIQKHDVVHLELDVKFN